MKPFRNFDSFDFFNKETNKIIEKINSFDNEYLLKVRKEDIFDNLISEAIFEEVVLKTSEKVVSDNRTARIPRYDSFDRTTYMVQGSILEISIPFEGNPIFFEMRASHFSVSGYSEIGIYRNHITLNFEYLEQEAQSEQLKKKIDSAIKNLEQGVEFANNDVRQHNEKIRGIISLHLDKRILSAKKIVEAVHGLGIPVKSNSVPDTYVSAVKRKVRISEIVTQAISKTGKNELAPVLSGDDFNYILEVLSRESKTMERTPSVFANLDEESIRTLFLMHLNGHFEGSATGETFNNSGKTDILIREKDKNIFIAECKFWKGEKSFNDAIDQLLSYLTWRDCKCALLIFNKNRDSYSVAEKMHSIMMNRNEFKALLDKRSNGTILYQFAKVDEPRNSIIIATQLFDIPLE